jgi:RHS repeat-associated protein
MARARRWDGDTSLATDPVPSGVAAADLSYVYGAGGRVLKVATDAQGNTRATVYVFAGLELRRAQYFAGSNDYDRSVNTEVVDLGLTRVSYEPNAPSPTNAPLHVLLRVGDNLGSSSLLVDKETGQLAEARTYLAYGETESDYRPATFAAIRDDVAFTGKEEDVELGIQYFGARYLVPALGRWASADPLATHTLGADLNEYAYVHGRVYGAIDPNGLDEKDGIDPQALAAAEKALQNPPRSDAEIDAMIDKALTKYESLQPKGYVPKIAGINAPYAVAAPDRPDNAVQALGTRMQEDATKPFSESVFWYTVGGLVHSVGSAYDALSHSLDHEDGEPLGPYVVTSKMAGESVETIGLGLTAIDLAGGVGGPPGGAPKEIPAAPGGPKVMSIGEAELYVRSEARSTAELVSAANADGAQFSPCVAACVHRPTGITTYGANLGNTGATINGTVSQEVMRDVNPALADNWRAFLRGHFSTPGNHAELIALNKGLNMVGNQLGRAMTAADLGDFSIHVVWSNPGPGRPFLGPAAMCGNCQQLATGAVVMTGRAQFKMTASNPSSAVY